VALASLQMSLSSGSTAIRVYGMLILNIDTITT
jgi:hypothetical protein